MRTPLRQNEREQISLIKVFLGSAQPAGSHCVIFDADQHSFLQEDNSETASSTHSLLSEFKRTDCQMGLALIFSGRTEIRFP